MSSQDQTVASVRLTQLLTYLDADPMNLALTGDAAEAAYAAGRPTETIRLLDVFEAQAPLPATLTVLRGLALISLQDYRTAGGVFEALLETEPTSPGLRFNLAWCRAMLRDFSGADVLLDEAVVAATPGAAALKVQALHGEGRSEEALAFGLGLAERRPDDPALMSAIAVAAFDADDKGLAEAFALRAGRTPESLSTLGLLRLGDDQVAEASALFDEALQGRPSDARAVMGKGLTLLLTGAPEAAAAHLDRSATLFGSHVGSWVAAGWAYLVASDLPQSRRCFETALELDPRFAETQGALAVLDVLDDRLGRARRRTTIARRLDDTTFGGALARSLLLEREGQSDVAETVRLEALNRPVTAGGRTLAQIIVALGFAGVRGPGA